MYSERLFVAKGSRRLVCAPGALDFRLAIALDAEDRIRLGVRWAAEIRIYIFPDDTAVRRHLEEAAEHPFVDEGVAVGQAPRVRNTVAEEILRQAFLELPRDRFRRRVDFQDARIRERFVEPVWPVIEKKHVPVLEQVRRVLTGERRRS